METIDNITELLNKAGLSKSEIAVYEAGRRLKLTITADIVRATKMPRPTVLAALVSLREQGLCTTKKLDGRSLVYAMQPISALNTYLGNKIRQTSELLENINAVSEEPVELAAHQVEGQVAVQDLLELALRCKSRKWQIIAPKDNALRYMPSTYTTYFKQVRRERQIESQSLWAEMDKKDNLGLYDVLMRKPRYVSKDITKQIPSLLLAFDDKLLVIDGTDHPSAALITSSSVTKTFAVIFELAWRSCREA